MKTTGTCWAFLQTDRSLAHAPAGGKMQLFSGVFPPSQEHPEKA